MKLVKNMGMRWVCLASGSRVLIIMGHGQGAFVIAIEKQRRSFSLEQIVLMTFMSILLLVVLIKKPIENLLPPTATAVCIINGGPVNYCIRLILPVLVSVRRSIHCR